MRTTVSLHLYRLLLITHTHWQLHTRRYTHTQWRRRWEEVWPFCHLNGGVGGVGRGIGRLICGNKCRCEDDSHFDRILLLHQSTPSSSSSSSSSSSCGLLLLCHFVSISTISWGWDVSGKQAASYPNHCHRVPAAAAAAAAASAASHHLYWLALQ